MNIIASRLNAAAKTALLLGVSTFAFAGLAHAAAGDAAPMVAQNTQMPENVVITGSLIRGVAPVGASLTSLG